MPASAFVTSLTHGRNQDNVRSCMSVRRYASRTPRPTMLPLPAAVSEHDSPAESATGQPGAVDVGMRLGRGARGIDVRRRDLVVVTHRRVRCTEQAPRRAASPARNAATASSTRSFSVTTCRARRASIGGSASIRSTQPTYPGRASRVHAEQRCGLERFPPPRARTRRPRAHA